MHHLKWSRCLAGGLRVANLPERLSLITRFFPSFRLMMRRYLWSGLGIGAPRSELADKMSCGKPVHSDTRFNISCSDYFSISERKYSQSNRLALRRFHLDHRPHRLQQNFHLRTLQQNSTRINKYCNFFFLVLKRELYRTK